MTKTYLIHAWCIRPFITVLDVEADTPEQAIAIARRQHDQLLDAAEDCDGQYPWEEFAAYDESGKELLRYVLDEKACVRNAAPVMRETLLYVAQELASFKPDYLRQIGLDVALVQVEKALAIADNTSAQASAPAAEDDQD